MSDGRLISMCRFSGTSGVERISTSSTRASRTSCLRVEDLGADISISKFSSYEDAAAASDAPYRSFMAGQNTWSSQVSKSVKMSPAAASVVPKGAILLPPLFSITLSRYLGIRWKVLAQSRCPQPKTAYETSLSSDSFNPPIQFTKWEALSAGWPS